MRNFLTWVIVFIVGLLIGFVPQYWKARGLREELMSCHTKADLAKVQQSAALTYVAAFVATLGNLLYLLMMLGGGRRDD